MPIVTVQQSPRGLDQKRRLVEAITQAFVDAYGVSPKHVQVFIHEVDHENWAKAGTLAVDRGFLTHGRGVTADGARSSDTGDARGPIGL